MDHGFRWNLAALLRLGMCVGLLCAVGDAAAQSPSPGFDPGELNVTLQFGECQDRAVSFTTAAAPVPKTDVLLLIDVTSSMDDVINEVTLNASQIVADVRDLTSDAAFAVATLADYPGESFLSLFGLEYGSADDYPWRLEQDLTTDETLIQSALNNISLKNGGDANESYLRALYESQFISWRPGSRRLVILFGDDLPHDPDPGPDGTENTSDDLTQTSVTDQLASASITVLGIYTNSDPSIFYETVAEATGGQAFEITQSEEVPGTVQSLVANTITEIDRLSVDLESPGSQWVETTPANYTKVGPLETKSFNFRFCANEGPAGDYAFDAVAMGDGSELARLPIKLHILAPTPTPTPIPTSTPLPSPTVTQVPTSRPVILAPVVPPSVPSFNVWWLILPLIGLAVLGLIWWLKNRHSKRTT